MSSSAFEDSNSFLFGLNHFTSPQPSGSQSNNMNGDGSASANAGRGANDGLLTGLESFGTGAGAEQGDLLEGGSFADQLALWTNANFSFDGPTGHALLGDEEKDKDAQDKDGDDAGGDYGRRAGKRSRNQGGDNNDPPVPARNGKNRLRDENDVAPRPDNDAREAVGPQAPQLDHRSRSNSHHDGGKQAPNGFAQSNGFSLPSGFAGFGGSAFQQSGGHGAPQNPSSNGAFQSTPQGQVDLASLLALQQLINQNPLALASLGGLNNINQLSALTNQLGNNSAQAPNLLQQLQQQLQQQQQQQRSTPLSGQHPTTPNANAHQPAFPNSGNFNSWSFNGLNQAPGSFSNGFQHQGGQYNGNHVNGIQPTDSASPSIDGSRQSLDDGDLSGFGNGKSRLSLEERAELLAQRAAERDNIPPLKLINTGDPEADAEANKNAIEEDKRRRNTAASARFRQKKKQREAALESHTKELEDTVAELRGEIEKLRNENTWLKGLIQVRTDGQSSGEATPSKTNSTVNASSKKGSGGNPSSVETLQAAQQLQALQHAMSSQQAAQSQLQAHLQRVNNGPSNRGIVSDRTRDTGIRPRGVGTESDAAGLSSGQKRDRDD